MERARQAWEEPLLERRLRALARRAAPAAKADAAPVHAQVVWSLGPSLFGIDVEAVRAVIPFPGCTAVPGRQPACLGVISRMGRFYSVIGLRRLMALPEDEPPGHLLLLRGAAPYLALAVDRVLGRFEVTRRTGGAGGEILGGSPEVAGGLVAGFDPGPLLQRLGHAV
jgi:chemotaxis signal transduction protein